MLMATRMNIDFHAVEEKHAEIHKRLENWAKWARGSYSPSVSPMFRDVRSAAQARGAEHSWALSAVDGLDAQRIAKQVAHLPAPHRKAINWCYLKPVSPRTAASDIGTTLEGLALLLRDARQMLVNRGA